MIGHRNEEHREEFAATVHLPAVSVGSALLSCLTRRAVPLPRPAQSAHARVSSRALRDGGPSGRRGRGRPRRRALVDEQDPVGHVHWVRVSCVAVCAHARGARLRGEGSRAFSRCANTAVAPCSLARSVGRSASSGEDVFLSAADVRAIRRFASDGSGAGSGMSELLATRDEVRGAPRALRPAGAAPPTAPSAVPTPPLPCPCPPPCRTRCVTRRRC